MLLACIKSERLKLKHSYIWAAFLLLPVIPTIMGTMNYLNNLGLLKSEWSSLWTQETLFYSNFFFAPMIAVCCSYLWRMENQNKNRHMLFTVPVPLRDIFLGKFAAIIKITVAIQLWIYVLYLISGKLVHLPGFPPIDTFFYTLRGILGGMVIAALQMLFSMLIRSFAVPIVIAAIGSVTGLLASNSVYGPYYPYSLMMMGMNANKTEDILTGGIGAFLLSSLFYLALIYGAAVLIMKKQDVRG